MNRDVHWVMDISMGADSDVHAYVDAVRRSGATVEEVVAIPFDEAVPGSPCAGPTVLYGSVSFVTRAHACGRWQPGAFSTPETFTYEAWAKHYGPLLLNAPEDADLTTPTGFLASNRPNSDLVFVRPQRDTKELNGTVWSVGEFREECRKACAGQLAGVSSETPIVVCVPYGIEAEWRTFVVEDRIVAASQYRRRGQLHRVAGAPGEILAFAEMVAGLWSPARAYVLDVCLSADRPYIVEAQGFNSSGTYAANLASIIESVNDAARHTWTEA